MLRALITKVELGYPESGVPSVKLKGEDRSIDMGLVEKKKRWTGTTVTGIVKEIAKPYRFKNVEARLDPDHKVASEHQDSKTDLAFLQDLAKKYHAKCFVELDENDGEVLYFIPERRVVRLRPRCSCCATGRDQGATSDVLPGVRRQLYRPAQGGQRPRRPRPEHREGAGAAD